MTAAPNLNLKVRVGVGERLEEEFETHAPHHKRKERGGQVEEKTGRFGRPFGSWSDR